MWIIFEKLSVHPFFDFDHSSNPLSMRQLLIRISSLPSFKHHFKSIINFLPIDDFVIDRLSNSELLNVIVFPFMVILRKIRDQLLRESQFVLLGDGIRLVYIVFEIIDQSEPLLGIQRLEPLPLLNRKQRLMTWLHHLATFNECRLVLFLLSLALSRLVRRRINFILYFAPRLLPFYSDGLRRTVYIIITLQRNYVEIGRLLELLCEGGVNLILLYQV